MRGNLRTQRTHETYDAEEGFPYPRVEDGDMQVRRTIIGLIGSRLSPRTVAAIGRSATSTSGTPDLPDFELKGSRIEGILGLGLRTVG